MISSFSFEQWLAIATIIIAAATLIVTVRSSRKTDKVASKQVELAEDLLRRQRNVEISSAEFELARVKAEYAQLKTRAKIEADAEQRKSFSLEVGDYYMERFEPQFKDYENRILRLTKTLNELKSKR